MLPKWPGLNEVYRGPFQAGCPPFPVDLGDFNNGKEKIWGTVHAGTQKAHRKFCNLKICSDYKQAFLSYAKFKLHKTFQNKTIEQAGSVSALQRSFWVHGFAYCFFLVYVNSCLYLGFHPLYLFLRLQYSTMWLTNQYCWIFPSFLIFFFAIISAVQWISW